MILIRCNNDLSRMGRLAGQREVVVRLRRFLIAFAAVLLLPTYGASAQGGSNRKVGVILQGGSWYQVVEGLRDGLKALGFEEGRQFALDIHDMHGDLKAVEQQARSLEQQQVALIYTLSTSVSVAAKRGTTKTPIVFVAGTNPVAVDLVQTIPRPGGRLTGVQFRATDLTGKRLEILLEIAPQVRRIVAFYDPKNPSARESAHEAREATQKLGLELVERHVGSVSQLQGAVEALTANDADAVIAISDAMVDSHIQYVIDMANARKLPTMVYDPGAVAKGGLATYSADYHEVGRLTAKYVQRILQGANPGDLAVEGADKVALIVNLKTAKQLGLTISESVLSRADRTID
jgi:putative ABC transport system substrate-binding protein